VKPSPATHEARVIAVIGLAVGVTVAGGLGALVATKTIAPEGLLAIAAAIAITASAIGRTNTRRSRR
jgi:hypothetical protein